MKHLGYIPICGIFILSPLFCTTDTYLAGITTEVINAILLLVCGGILIGTKVTFNFNKLDGFFLMFLCWYGGLCLFRGEALDRWALIQLITYILLYGYARSGIQARQFFLCLFCAGLLQGVWGILQAQNLLLSQHYLFKTTGSFFNPALWGIFITLSALSGLALYDRNFKTGIKLCWGTGMFFLVACIFISSSRASWLAFVTGSGWLLLGDPRTGMTERLKTAWRKYKSFRYTAIFTLCILLFGIIPYGLYILRPDSVHGRWLIWQVIGSTLPQAPLFGRGFLEASYMPMQADWFEAHPDSSFAQLAGNNIYAFNELLRIVFETGITGLLLFSGLLITACIFIWRGNLFCRQSGALLFALMCFGMFSYPFSVPLLTMAGVAALAMISQHSVAGKTVVFRPDRPLRWGLWLAAGLFLVFVAGEYHLEKRADRLLGEAQHNRDVLTDSCANRYYAKLAGNPDFVLCYGKTLYNGELYAEALPILKQAAHLRPSSPLMCDLGDCHRYAEDYTQAEQAYLRAARMTPAYILPHYRLFCLYRDTGKTGKATDKARYMLNMPVKVVNTSVLRYRSEARRFLKASNQS